MTQMPPPTGPVAYGAPNPSQSTGLAVGSVICGVISVILSLFSFCLWFLSLPLAIVAIVLAVIARGKIARGEAGGEGLAKAGLITGVIGLILSIMIPVILGLFFRTAGEKFRQQLEKEQQRIEQQQRSGATTQPSTE
jgi:lysylphosphatidylglycerol synthetase-like protein (DUF2156 family)